MSSPQAYQGSAVALAAGVRELASEIEGIPHEARAERFVGCMHRKGVLCSEAEVTAGFFTEPRTIQVTIMPPAAFSALNGTSGRELNHMCGTFLILQQFRELCQHSRTPLYEVLAAFNLCISIDFAAKPTTPTPIRPGVVWLRQV